MKYRAVLSIFHGRAAKGEFEGRPRHLYRPGDFYDPTEDELENTKKVREALRQKKMDELPQEVILGAVPPHFVPENQWTQELVDSSEFEARMRKVSIRPQKAKDLNKDDMRLVNIMRAAGGLPAITKEAAAAVK